MGRERTPSDAESDINDDQNMSDAESEDSQATIASDHESPDVSDTDDDKDFYSGVYSEHRINYGGNPGQESSLEPDESAARSNINSNVADEIKSPQRQEPEDHIILIPCNICRINVRQSELKDHQHKYCNSCRRFYDYDEQQFSRHQEEQHNIYKCQYCLKNAGNKERLVAHQLCCPARPQT